MNELTPSKALPNIAATPAQLQREYKLPFSRSELQFLEWFIPWVFQNWTWREDLIELTVLFDFARRHRDRLAEPKDCKLKVRAHEMIALKRMIWKPALSPEWDVDRKSLFTKIDQLTVGIQ